MELHKVGFSGRRRGEAFFDRSVWFKLQFSERGKLLILLSNNQQNHWGRNVYLKLNSPIETERGKIAALRLKGSAPLLPPKEHDGEGYVPCPLEVSRDGRILPWPSEGAQPEGGAFSDSAENEFRVARDLGPPITDHAVAYGVFSGLEFHHEKMGFVILGQEAAEDKRLRRDCILAHDTALRLGPKVKMEGLVDLEPLAGSLGKVLSEFHKKYSHGYPHFNNIGIIPDRSRVVIRDLESCAPLWENNQQQRFGYLGIDLLKILAGLWEVKTHFDGTEYPLGDPLGSFLHSYFNASPPRAALEEEKIGHFFETVSFLLSQRTTSFSLEKFLSANPSAFAGFLHERLLEQSSPSNPRGQRQFPF